MKGLVGMFCCLPLQGQYSDRSITAISLALKNVWSVVSCRAALSWRIFGLVMVCRGCRVQDCWTCMQLHDVDENHRMLKFISALSCFVRDWWWAKCYCHWQQTSLIYASVRIIVLFLPLLCSVLRIWWVLLWSSHILYLKCHISFAKLCIINAMISWGLGLMVSGGFRFRVLGFGFRVSYLIISVHAIHLRRHETLSL